MPIEVRGGCPTINRAGEPLNFPDEICQRQHDYLEEAWALLKKYIQSGDCDNGAKVLVKFLSRTRGARACCTIKVARNLRLAGTFTASSSAYQGIYEKIEEMALTTDNTWRQLIYYLRSQLRTIRTKFIERTMTAPPGTQKAIIRGMPSFQQEAYTAYCSPLHSAASGESGRFGF